MRWFALSKENQEGSYKSSSVSPANLAILMAVLVVAAALRYYGLANADNTDEYNEVFEALRVASGKFNVNRWHKKGFQNLLAIEYGVYFVAGYARGLWSSANDFAVTIISNLEPLFLIGRYTTATMGSASVFLLYWIGSRIYNPRVGLIAASLLAVCSMHVWTSHLVNTDVPLTFFFLLTLFFVTRLYDSGLQRDYCIAAALAAVTINVKIIGVGILVIYGLAHIFRSRLQEKSLMGTFADKKLLYAAIWFVGGLLLSNPAILVGFKQWVLYFVWQYGIYTNVYEEVPYALNDNGFYTYAILMWKEFGPFLSALVILAFISSLMRRRAWDVILLSFTLSMYGILGGTTFLVQNRYFMTIVPALFLLVGCTLDRGLALLQRGWQRMAVAVFAMVFVLAIPFYRSIIETRTLTDENTSVIAKRWIEGNIPAGSKILIDGGRTILTSGPRLNQSRAKIEELIHLIQSLKEGQTYDSPQVKIVDSYSAVYFELLLKTTPAVTYDLTTTELGRQIEPLQFYRDHGFDYFVHNLEYEDHLLDRNWREKYPESTVFYESLQTSLVLLRSFEPSTTRSGPTIAVYKFQ